jgi:predicted  nucleic acid-binding Zn-ribbon protein
MSSSDLFELYRLHQVDHALLEMKQRAATLDGGKAILAEIRAYQAEHAEVLEAPKKIAAQIQVLTEKNEAIALKVKEAAALEHEIALLKGQEEANTLEAMELIELQSPAQEAAKPYQRHLSTLAKAFEAKKNRDVEESKSLQVDFKAKSAERPGFEKIVKPSLLSQYDAIRQKYAGVGLAVVRGQSCGACGTILADRILLSLDNDKVIQCETCHRILFKLIPGT